MMRWFIIMVLAAGAVLAGWFGVTEWRLAAIENVPYRVETSDGSFEIRNYPQQILVSVHEEGARSTAFNEALEPLLGFIGGDNSADDRIDMTRPVLQAPDDETVAIADLPGEETNWRISLIMPQWFTVNTLPQPTSSAVEVSSRPAERVAVVSFTGSIDDERLAKETETLNAWMKDKNLSPEGPPRYAFYDPAWRLPMRRRSAVMIPIAAAQ